MADRDLNIRHGTGTLATSVNVKNPQTSNHSELTLIPLFQKLVVMLIDRLPHLAQACPR
jgi:hypothetical protein